MSSKQSVCLGDTGVKLQSVFVDYLAEPESLSFCQIKVAAAASKSGNIKSVLNVLTASKCMLLSTSKLESPLNKLISLFPL